MFDDWISAPAVALAVAYSWLSHNLGAPFAAFAKDFQFAAILTVTLIFIMVSLFIMLRQAKRKLPKSYVIEIIDVYGETVTIDGVRQVFRTYEAAESYARMYRQNFSHYRFKVVGSQNVIPGTPGFTLW
jgi:ABC-type transport system involved in cytochrome bd biosynthesis fused ATPase/permease subunit